MAETSTHPQHESFSAARKAARWRLLKIVAIAVVAVVILIWVGLWLYHRLTHVSEDDARVATHEITISSRLAGRVTGFDLIEGDPLHKAEQIAQLYSKPDTLKLQELQARVARMHSQIAVQRKRISLSRSQLSGGVEQTKDMLKADQAAADAAKANMAKARNTYRRSQKLYQAHGATQQQRDVDRYSYQAARASYAQARRQVAVDRIALENAKTGMLSGGQISVSNPDVLKKELSVMQSQLAEARATLAHQQNRINDLTVKSPIVGVVDRTFIEQDEYVSAGQPILMMHDPRDVWIEAKMKETKIHSLRVGQPVAIHVDARPDTRYRGHVQVIGDAATNQFALLPDPNPSGNFTKITQRIPVRIAIDHGPLKALSPGMMVEVDVDITDKPQKKDTQGQQPIPTRGIERQSR